MIWNDVISYDSTHYPQWDFLLFTNAFTAMPPFWTFNGLPFSPPELDCKFVTLDMEEHN
jgi:hypothetical protein